MNRTITTLLAIVLLCGTAFAQKCQLTPYLLAGSEVIKLDK